MPDNVALPPSREVFEAEIIDVARDRRPEEALAEMLVRYFCESWTVHSVPGSSKFCLHLDADTGHGWQGDSFAHVFTVALLGEYDLQFRGDE